MRRPALALLLGCLLLVAGVSALDGYAYYQTIEYAACDQEIYQQDIVIHRSTGTAYNETAGGLETWHIYVGDHCREDYGDVRFTNSTGAELAYYLWPDYSSESARFAVRLEGATSAGVLQVWYGNPSATTTSNGTNTFLLCTDFDDSTSPFTQGSAAASFAGGFVSSATSLDPAGKSLKLSGSSTAKARYIPQTFGRGIQVDYYQYIPSNNPTASLGGVHLASPGGSSINGYQCVLDERADAHPNLQIRENFDYTSYFGGALKLTTIVDRWYKIRVTWATDGTITFSRCDAITGQVYDTASGKDTTYSSGYLGFCTYDVSYFDQVTVRAYSATPPAAATFSGEQETPTLPATAFTAAPITGLAPLTVQFTDLSGGRPTSWLWTFGDGNTSTAQNPQHTYTAPRLYTVTLNATNEYGSDEEIRTDYITVYAPVTAQFSANITSGTAPLTVQFTDLSTGGPTSWLWTFGDGNTSTAQNPQHTYTTAGTHTVTLIASHPYDSDTETKTAYITVAVLQPFPGLTLIPRDLTGNGLYTDINGNNRLDYNDLTIFFQHLAWAKTAQPTSCFDFNQNGRLDYADVIALFQVIKNA